MAPRNRRWLLRSGTLALAGGLAGCSADGGSSTDRTTGSVTRTTATRTESDSDCRIENALGDADPIPVTVDGRVGSDVETTVAVRWNARTQSSMAEQDSFGQYTPSRGRTYVVFRLELENVTERDQSVAPYDLFGLRQWVCDAVWAEQPSLLTLDSVFDLSPDLEPGESVSGIMPFEVPRDLDWVQLVRYVERDDKPDNQFTATCDRSLDIGIGLA